MEQISPNNATETELYNSLTNSCSHSAGMKNNGTSEDKARDQLLSYEIQNKMMLQHNEPYIIVDKEIYRYNIPYEFLPPRISFKTEQILSYFPQEITDLIWGKYAERQRKIFLDIQSFFMKLYKGNERHPGIVISTHSPVTAAR